MIEWNNSDSNKEILSLALFKKRILALIKARIKSLSIS